MEGGDEMMSDLAEGCKEDAVEKATFLLRPDKEKGPAVCRPRGQKLPDKRESKGSDLSGGRWV